MIGIVNRDWIGEAQTFLQEKFNRFCVTKCSLSIEPPLDETEAEYFILGLEHGMFSVDEKAYAQAKFLPSSSGKDRDRNKILQVFWAKPKPHVFREGICQLSTVAALVLKYGWQVDMIEMEPRIPTLRYAIDFRIRDPRNEILICGDVKSCENELKSLRGDFRYCCSIGPHLKTQCRKQNHRKYAFCFEFKPLYFFATCPGREVSFKLSHDGQMAIENEFEGLIHHNKIENSVSPPEIKSTAAL